MKKLKLLILATLILLVMTGCGASKSNSDSEKTPATTLEKIKAAGKITFAMSGQYPPFNYFNEENELTGFDVEIGQEIAKRINVNPEPIATEWDGIIAGLTTSKFDMILGSMAITDERLQKVNFSNPYYRSGAQIIVPSDSTISGADDLKGKTVGVVLGTTFETKARELGANVNTYKGDPDAFHDMLNGRLDAVITDKIVGLNAIKNNNYPFKLVGDLIYVEKMGIAIRKDSPELLDAVNKALTDMMDDGTYKAISEKYFNQDIR
ncbi:periplasmic component of amino acid ABC-type transporter/signal transduction system [Desulfosporosinus orientis DSM 765]|uniref:Periplasmic component of amino acid ABC-type transporter/signal transduction system n=1 Tax=Desulfosporosinus orientis (strain ATCC 19365 / DSM 765 / NCIMB 8382 / VKM B-1628 / Singapore I) TaxID=768706 RepID=G7WE60_DESOD|nr:ABC transporter substrate-binding protein [Desulfosporosinus orientis]AET70036.1 periplasmic component of amino acid ABC-type transporter/signal transduction system [Desulfosporosinus orientis DSM 765]